VVKDYNKIIRNISVAIAGIFEKCGNLTQQDAPHKNKEGAQEAAQFHRFLYPPYQDSN
jgi:hypothetical protein